MRAREAGGDDPGQVLGQTAAGDVSHGAHIRGLHQSAATSRGVDLGGCEQRRADGVAAEAFHFIHRIGDLVDLEYLPDQGETVAVHAAGGQADDARLPPRPGCRR